MLIYNCERTNEILTIVRGYSPLTIVYRHMLILLFIMNLKMTVGRSKRRSFLNNINILYFLYDGPLLLGKHCFEQKNLDGLFNFFVASFKSKEDHPL